MPCPEQPSFEETAAALRACLDREGGVAEVEQVLASWGWINDEWGGVTEGDLLPGGGQELLLSYYPDLTSAGGDPRGYLLILQQQRGRWIEHFSGALNVRHADGTTWSNWRHRPLQLVDVTGDGLDDVLLELLYSNGLRSVLRYVAVVSVESDSVGTGVYLPFVEDVTGWQTTFSPGGDQSLVLTIANRHGPDAVTRTYTFSGETFELASEAVNPAISAVSVSTPDGWQWLSFDQLDGMGGWTTISHLGLYRIRRGETERVDVPLPVRALEVAPDGTLYVAAGCGILRREGEGDGWQTLADPDCDGESTLGGPPPDMAIAGNNDVWVAALFSLAHFDGQRWTTFDVNASRLLIVPDGTVWAAGWDGRAESSCCIVQVEGETSLTYGYEEALPVEDELAEQIRGLLE